MAEFLKRHRNSVTVTTKFGIPAERRNKLRAAGRAVLSPLLQAAPGLKKMLSAAMQVGIRHPAKPLQQAPQPNPNFTVAAARASLESSLTALATDHIDLWLLHEVRAIDLEADPHQDALLRFLEDAVRQGKIGLFGVGSDRDQVPALLRDHPQYCRAVQQEWSVLNPVSHDPASFHLYHRALSQHFSTVAETLRQDAVLRKRWSAELGQDLTSPGTLARLMLKASYVLNEGSIVLFSSKKSSHIIDNVTTVGDPSLDVAAQKFYGLLQKELLQPKKVKFFAQ